MLRINRPVLYAYLYTHFKTIEHIASIAIKTCTITQEHETKTNYLPTLNISSTSESDMSALQAEFLIITRLHSRTVKTYNLRLFECLRQKPISKFEINLAFQYTLLSLDDSNNYARNHPC